MVPVERCARDCAEQAWRLAYGLLGDVHEAYDAVQQAFVVAARKPEAVPAHDPWPWFRVVVAHEARNLRRKRRPSPRGFGEEGGEMHPPDPRSPEPSTAVIEADEARRLWAAVGALPPPEREAVVLSHLGGMTHAATAEVLGVPRQTVTERARRGLEALGVRLRRDASAAAHALAILPAAPPPEGLEAARTAWVGAAMSKVAAAGSAVVGVGTQGGMAMVATKAAWVGGIALAAGIGFLGGGATDGFGLFDGDRPETSRVVREPQPVARSEGASGPGADAPTLAAMGDEGDLASRQENERLAARVALLEKELAARPAAAPSGPRGPLFTFGEMGRLDAVREADWAVLGSASKVVADSILEIFRRNEAGEPVPKEVYRRLQENVERVRTYEYRTIDKMPTAAQHNGELTHPISATNLLASVLEQGGEPLSAAQVAEFDRLGVEFEADFARVRAGWTADVPRARRLLEEVRLKGRFMDALWAGLTASQRPLWVDPAYRGVASIDLFDPTLMVIHTSPIVAAPSVPEMRTKLLALLKPKVAATTEATDVRLEAAVDAFVARTGRNLTAVPRVRVKHYTFTESVQAGEATAELVDALLRDLPLTADARKALLEDPSWYVLRLVPA